MEMIDFLKLQYDRTILESLELLLEELASRPERPDCQPRERLIAVDAQRLTMQIRHLLSVPIDIASNPIQEAPPSPVPSGMSRGTRSRIADGVMNGSIKPSQGTGEAVSFGIGKVEITENDEIVDEVTPDNILKFQRKDPLPPA